MHVPIYLIMGFMKAILVASLVIVVAIAICEERFVIAVAAAIAVVLLYISCPQIYTSANSVVIGGQHSMTIKNNSKEYAVVHIEYNGEDSRYNCYIEKDGLYHKILYTYGPGEYRVQVYNGQAQSKPYLEFTKRVRSATKYKGSSYNVELDKYSSIVDSIIQDNKWDKHTELSTIWEYFSKYEYEYEVEDEISNGNIKVFIPNLDDTVSKKAGICYDMASLVTCICRKLYGEAKMCIGYNGKDYHAWCEVYYDNKWYNMDTIKREYYNNGRGNEEYEVIQTY